MKAMKVSIILPIFNAPDDLRRCLESVRVNTSDRVQMLLINDGSSNPLVAEIVADFLKSFPSAKLLENIENIGFVKTCNRGFKHTAQDDVILLNSDTVVTKNWVEKLTEAAYSAEKVATVTPLTNNGTICSIPDWLVENEIPDDFTVDTFASFVEEISLRRYPSIPTGVGFCMYIKRSVLQEIGYFNEAEFDKGYGEENDLCYRANRAGYINIVDDRTFIFHAGGKSFGPAKQKIVEVNLRRLTRLHPTYPKDIAEFIASKPLGNIIDNVALRLFLEDLKRKDPICFVLHNSIDKPVNHPLGGTETLCQSIVSITQEQHPVYVIFPDKSRGTLNLDIYYKNEKRQLIFDCPSLKYSSNRLLMKDLDFRTLLSSLMSVLKPNIVHIHHLIHLPVLDVTAVVKPLNIPIVLSLHDYYFICPSYNLIDKYGRFCIDYKDDGIYCSTCIQSQFEQGPSLKKEWKEACTNLLEAADLIVAPSNSCANYYKNEFQDLTSGFEVIPHGLSDEYLHLANQRKSEAVSKSKKEKLVVGFVGGINKPKGSSRVLEIVLAFWKNSAKRDRVFFKMIGELDLPVPTSCLNFIVTGRYSKSELIQHLADVDVVVCPSQCSETYCLTADEVLALGIPIITTPIGAVPERVSRINAGWVTQDLSSESISKVITECIDNPELVEQKAAAARSYSPASMTSVSQKYIAQYSNFAKSNDAVAEGNTLTQLSVSKESFNSTFLSAYYSAQNTTRLVDDFIGSRHFPRLSWVKRRNPRLWEAARVVYIKVRYAIAR